MLRLDLPWFIAFPYLFIIGAVVGSFLNVCIYRIPTRERFLDQLRALWEKPSHCPRCGTNIRWFDNVPILGWLNLRGRCRKCRMRISMRYPLIEFLNGCLWMLVFWYEVPLGLLRNLDESCLFADIGPQVIPGLGPISPEWFVIIRFAFHIVLVEALLVASMIDFDLRIIPDGSTLPAMAVGLLGGLFFARLHLVPVWFQSPELLDSLGHLAPGWLQPLMGGPAVPEWIVQYPHLHGLIASLAGLLVGGGIVWMVRILGFWLLKQEAIGFGDVILMAMAGAFVGWQPILISFFIAPLLALVAVFFTSLFRRGDNMIPYGPYLSLGVLVTLLYWRSIFESTQHIFELGILLVPIALFFCVIFAGLLLVVQGLKWMLGIQPVHEPEVTGVWRAADQTWFFNGENVNRHTGRWKTHDWEGNASGRGQIHQERWRGNWPK